VPILAIGAVDLVAFIVALAVILALAAFWVPCYLLQKILGAIPLVGGYIGDALTNGVEAAMQAVIGTFDGLTHAVAHFLWTFGVGIWHLVYQTVAAIADAKTTALNALGIATGAEAGAIAAAHSLFDQAQAHADAVGSTVLGEAEGLYNAAITHADDVGNTVLGESEALYNAAVGQIAASSATVLDQAEALYNSAVAHADDVGSTVLGESEALYNAAIADITSTADVINAHVDQILSEAESFASDAATAAGAAAIAGAVAQVLPRVEALEAEATECIEPMCEALQPNLSSLGKVGSLFSLLEGGTLWVLLAALLGEAAADPTGAIDDVIGAVAPLVSDTASGLRDLIGV
jgi:hypothetical protein